MQHRYRWAAFALQVGKSETLIAPWPVWARWHSLLLSAESGQTLLRFSDSVRRRLPVEVLQPSPAQAAVECSC